MSIYTNTGVVKPTKAWSELQFEAVRVWNVLVTVVRYVYTYELVPTYEYLSRIFLLAL